MSDRVVRHCTGPVEHVDVHCAVHSGGQLLGGSRIQVTRYVGIAKMEIDQKAGRRSVRCYGYVRLTTAGPV